MPVSTDPRIGSELLGYRIESVLGRGGMGVVYKAYDPRLKRYVALKLVAPELSGDERFRQRFLRESELAASLEHANVIPIHDAREVEGRLVIAMRLVEGTDLKQLLQKEGTLEPKRAVAICAQVAAALDAAHARGLVHRDVKPSNVLLDEEEHVYLADFGLTRRLADQGVTGEEALSIGTPAYISPEQIEGAAVDGRVDLYALGCLLYECLTGEQPFRRDSELAVLWAHVQEPPPRVSEREADLPAGIDAVIAKAMAKEPDERYANCAELVEAAREALGVEQPVRGRRTRALVAAVVLIAMAVLATGLVLALGGGEPKPDLTVRNNTLVRIDPKTNKVDAVIPVGRDPQSIAYGGRTVWVYNFADHTVEGIDARTNRIVVPPSAISGAPPTSNFKHPVAADSGGAWVVSVEPTGRGVLTRVRRNFSSTEQFPLPDSPSSIALGEGSIWVTTTSARESALLRISPRTGALTGKLRVRTVSMLGWIAVGEGAVWLADGSHIYRVDPNRMRLTGERSIECTLSCPAIAVGQGSVWIATNNIVCTCAHLLRMDPKTMDLTSVLTPSVSDEGADLAIEGDALLWNVYVAGVVHRVDTRTSKIVATIRLTGNSDVFLPFAIATGGGSVWASIANYLGRA